MCRRPAVPWSADMLKVFVRIAIAALVVVAAGTVSPPQAQQQVTVFAAASMKNALDTVNLGFTRKVSIRTVTSYGATSALMRQIEQGAPADIFISADLEWMDYGLKNNLINPETRVNLLGNQLVLIAPKNSKVPPVKLEKGFDLAKLVGDGRIVTGEVKSVPVGRYAVAALEKLGMWSSVEKRMAMVENVRVALTLVTRGEAAFGIVYATDARVEPGVKIVGHFPAGSHPEIVYPVAATVKANADAPRYIDYLQSSISKFVFEKNGFSFLVKPTS
ncbi:MAG: molybdate ABC transporter substrate-binding protein [Xanthobacteraceae bacterium]|nr:molybdate ABC transporter substrate-binding protein [Xanthobacteraceae bacterium]